MDTAGPDLRNLTLDAALVGLAPLVPVPLLDDRFEAAARRRMVRRLALAHGRQLPPDVVDALAGVQVRRGLGRRLRSAMRRTGRWFFRRLLRRLLFVLSLKDAVDCTSRTVHEGWLLDAALRAHDGPLTVEDARRVRAVLQKTLRHTRTRPVERAIRDVLRARFRRLRSAAELLAGAFRGSASLAADPGSDLAALPTDDQQETLLGSLVERLHVAVERQREHLEGVERDFRRRLAVA